MLSVQEGIRYEQNYIKTRPMLKKSSDTLFFFFHKKNTVTFHRFGTQKAVSYTTNGRIAPYIEK